MSNAVDDNGEWIRHFGNHIVSFESICKVPGQANEPSMEKLMVVTAYIMALRGYYFFVTAGHVFSRIEEFKATGVQFGPWKLFDSWGSNSTYEDPIPIDFETMLRKVLYFPEADDDLSGEKNGCDYALLPVRPLIGANLHANGIVPLTEAAWKSPLDAEYEQYCVFGFPSQFCVVERLGNDRYASNRNLLSVYVERINNPPKEKLRANPCFYGKIAHDVYTYEGEKLTDIKGMSGAPIFGMKDGRYGLVAMQSSWYPQSRTIVGVGMEHFGAWLERELLPYLEGSSDDSQPETQEEQQG